MLLTDSIIIETNGRGGILRAYSSLSQEEHDTFFRHDENSLGKAMERLVTAGFELTGLAGNQSTWERKRRPAPPPAIW